MTPMQEQYNKIKNEYPDAVVLFRLGDFYELFNEDAINVSKILGITLTSRGKDENKLPMAGIPYHAIANYLPKLVEAKLKIVIADQTEEAQPGKIVNREVTRIITPGTVTDTTILDDSKNNYLATVGIFEALDKYHFYIAYTDVTTGIINCFYTDNASFARQELDKISPTEIITNEVRSTLLIYERAYLSSFPKNFELEEAKKFLMDHFDTSSIEFLLPANIEKTHKNYLLIILTSLIYYINESQKTKNKHILKVSFVDFSPFVQLDHSSIKNLEIFASNFGEVDNSLYSILNECKTPMGKRLLRKYLIYPIKKQNLLQQRFDRVDIYFNNNLLLQEIRSYLQKLGDIERLASKIGNNSANPKDIKALLNNLQTVLQINDVLDQVEKIFTEVDIDQLKFLIDKINNTLNDDPAISAAQGEIIKDGVSAEVDKYRFLQKNTKQSLINIQSREIERTGISSLKISYNNVFGYYIEVSKANLSKVPKDYIRKQTLANAERYVTEELKQLEEEILSASQILIDLETEIFRKLLDELSRHLDLFINISEKIAEIDVLTNFAHISRERRYTKPKISNENKIVAGRHPVVERIVENFTPNDTHFDQDSMIHIITGPNMSGKSTYIRQVAIIYLMAQIGCYVPADEFHFNPLDKIFTRIGTADNLSKGESTFMIEMIETANILNNSNSNSLIILDEIGRGTSTYDGVAIAWSVIEYIHEYIKAKTLFATHYHEITSLENKLNGVKNYSVKTSNHNDEIIFEHKIITGATNKSYGVHVAKMAGIPIKVVDRANEILHAFETETGQIKPTNTKKSYVPKKPKSLNPDQLSLI